MLGAQKHAVRYPSYSVLALDSVPNLLGTLGNQIAVYVWGRRPVLNGASVGAASRRCYKPLPFQNHYALRLICHTAHSGMFLSVLKTCSGFASYGSLAVMAVYHCKLSGTKVLTPQTNSELRHTRTFQRLVPRVIRRGRPDYDQSRKCSADGKVRLRSQAPHECTNGCLRSESQALSPQGTSSLFVFFFSKVQPVQPKRPSLSGCITKKKECKRKDEKTNVALRKRHLFLESLS